MIGQQESRQRVTASLPDLAETFPSLLLYSCACPRHATICQHCRTTKVAHRGAQWAALDPDPETAERPKMPPACHANAPFLRPAHLLGAAAGTMRFMLVTSLGRHKACNRADRCTLTAVVGVTVQILQCIGGCQQAVGFPHSLLSISNCMGCQQGMLSHHLEAASH